MSPARRRSAAVLSAVILLVLGCGDADEGGSGRSQESPANSTQDSGGY